MKLKFASFYLARDALSDEIMFLPMSNFSDFGQKPWTIVHALIFGSPKKVWWKVFHLNRYAKGNLMKLISAA